ncbi:heavy-metal-associated domain-containing protein [Paucilactobacillus suebicus]|nr:heavy-metal-associated domain-containing protein [Paucilactobacillus suebicus]
MSQIATVKGMRCARCKMRVHHTLSNLDGVEDVSVDLQNGKATITGTNLTKERLNAAFDGTKFSITAVTEE